MPLIAAAALVIHFMPRINQTANFQQVATLALALLGHLFPTAHAPTTVRDAGPIRANKHQLVHGNVSSTILGAREVCVNPGTGQQ